MRPSPRLGVARGVRIPADGRGSANISGALPGRRPSDAPSIAAHARAAPPRGATAKSIIGRRATAAATDPGVTTISIRTTTARADLRCCAARITQNSLPSRQLNARPHDEPPKRPLKLRSEPWRFGMVTDGCCAPAAIATGVSSAQRVCYSYVATPTHRTCCCSCAPHGHTGAAPGRCPAAHSTRMKTPLRLLGARHSKKRA